MGVKVHSFAEQGERLPAGRYYPSPVLRLKAQCYQRQTSISVGEAAYWRPETMNAIVTLVAFAIFAAQTAAPNLAGRWKLDLDASTGTPPVPGASLLIVSQSEDDMQFQWEGNNGSLLAGESFPTDWSSNRRFSTRTQVGYARAHWRDNQFVVETKVVMDVDGYQSFSYTERWTISRDGKTLTQTSSDGKKLVFERVPDAPADVPH